MKTPFVVFATLPLVLAACSSSVELTPLPSGAEPPADCARADASGVITISAHDLRFSAKCMVAPAGVAFVVRFTNNGSEQHDVAIYRDPSKATKYLEGESFTGPSVTKDYPVAALPAGEYYFECTIHPGDMNGALYVR
jgi:plastocyanin